MSAVTGDRAYEALVWRVVNTRLKQYCNEVLIQTGRTPNRAVTVNVLTNRSLAAVRDDVRECVQDFLERDLGAVADVDFTVQPDLDPPGCQVHFDTEPEVVEADDIAGVRTPLWLRLTYSGMRPWSFALESDEAWIPVGRSVPGDGQRPPVSLPDYASAVPRLPLLHIQYWHGIASWRRSPLRSPYGVLVDGQRLTYGQVHPCVGEGTIEYVVSGGRTLLVYHLGWEAEL